MMRGLEMATLFLGFGVTGVGAGYMVKEVAERLRGGDDAHEVRVDVSVPEIDVDVDISELDVDVQVQCAYRAERTAALPASAAGLLTLTSGSGEVTVRGVEGLEQVRVVARACASREAYLEDLQITAMQNQGNVTLSAHYPEDRGLSIGNNYARLDLAVEVPAAMAVHIEDGSGGIAVSGTGALRVRDSSGELRVSDVRGDLDIEDSSGEIEVQSAAGRVTIQDSSGEIRVVDATGDVDIQDDSGEIELRNIRGNVRLRDGSGSIDAQQVEGSVVVEADGSGDIDVTQVTGDFSVRADGSGSIEHSGVGGRVDVPAPRGRRR
jgi:hypothetical protein